MMAWVYVVGHAEQAKALATIDLETDSLYWMDGDFRAGVSDTLGGAGPSIMQASWLRVLPSSLPLGIALDAVQLWNKRTAGKGVFTEQLADRNLRLCIAQAEQAYERGLMREKADDMPLSEFSEAAGGKKQRWQHAEPLRRLTSASLAARGARESEARRSQGQALAAAALSAASAMQGRALLHSEAHALLAAAGAARPTQASWNAVLQLAVLQGRLRLRSAIAREAAPRRWGAALAQALALPRPRRRCRCQRCGSGEARMRRTACAACGRRCAYCEACLGMGRARECGLLVVGGGAAPAAGSEGLAAPRRSGSDAAALARPAVEPLEQRLRRWGLSPAQLAAAGRALEFMEREPGDEAQGSGSLAARQFLLWAVTGAGKTEMIFPLIDSALQRGGRALVATPRRDVVLELDPRIRKAFPGQSVVTLYGGSEQRWQQGAITLATTHQLIRFGEAFELVIIDELDAFPFHNDEMLHYAAAKAGKPGGVTLLLSATPPAALQLAVKRGALAHARVPVRYHRHPLPVPVALRCYKTEDMLAKSRLGSALQQRLDTSLRRGAQVFIFLQRIRQIEPFVSLLRRAWPHAAIAGTSSQDQQRTEKVQQFRDREIRVLVTTTILERGVTVPKSDVYIMDADGKLFDEASLIQMAGRAGRSKEDPAGLVFFCAPARSRTQTAAIRQIRTMNRIAVRMGYIIEPQSALQ